MFEGVINLFVGQNYYVFVMKRKGALCQSDDVTVVTGTTTRDRFHNVTSSISRADLFGKIKLRFGAWWRC